MAAVKVVMGKVIHNGKHYGIGKVVKGLNKEDYARVIKAKIGVACSENELDDEEIKNVTADNRTPYRGNILTQEEKNKIDAESRKKALAEEPPVEKESKVKTKE